jgi:transposase-like protein
MSAYHPVYEPEFQQQMVDVVQSGRTWIEVTCEFGCTNQSIRNWVAQSSVARATEREFEGDVVPLLIQEAGPRNHSTRTPQPQQLAAFLLSAWCATVPRISVPSALPQSLRRLVLPTLSKRCGKFAGGAGDGIAA